MTVDVSLGLAALVGGGLGVVAGVIAKALLERIAGSVNLKRSGLAGLLALFAGNHEGDEMPAAVRRFLKNQQDARDALPEWAQKWVERSSKRLTRAGLRAPVGRYLLGTVLGAVLGFSVGITMLENFLAAVLLGMAAFLVPDLFLVGRMQAQNARMVEQLGAALRIFAAEFSDTPQVPRALARAAERIPPPLGGVLQRACRDLAAGKDRDEVLLAMMTALDFEYGRMFVQLLRIAWDDAAVRPLFSRLAMRVSALQSLMQKNRAELAGGRIMGLAVNFLILPIYFLVRYTVPESGEFLLEHPLGRLLVSLSFMSVLVGLFLNRLLNEVDV